ncbi:molybdopterin-dependent oxidoreductase, partial [Bacillus cereus]|nr:molybdopterin-dependent oxidoreductase [Bacillus cereus]
FINENVNFVEHFKERLEEYTREYVEEVTGVSKETHIQMAEIIRVANGTCILCVMGVTHNTDGSDTPGAISNLLLAAGIDRRAGAGAYPLQSHNIVQGAC